MRSRSIVIFILLTLLSSHALALGPSFNPQRATCTRSLYLLDCSDGQGNTYSVATHGETTYLRGYEMSGARRWAQTNSRYGQLTFFTGWASDGEAWVGSIQRVGWTTITKVSSSNGTRSTISCGRLTGCHELKR